ncbi:DUF3307 domain-containing protein [Shewanella corallii]|uniref:DUF3307 domain-containing protein n=1 Tax=Shewanella corallii TaxID=560080 RepID=A0ABT0N987_9GAMM|nr:DUF3307 domain-containing protein [Shewanella corallii]MCL2914974.1 DUF3307 domain-containing protein [Shewanella corallii]
MTPEQQGLLLGGLLLGHILGDFYLQAHSWVADRDRRHAKSPLLYIHALLHGILTLIVCLLFPLGWALPLVFAAAVTLSHFCFDLAKSYLPKKQIWFAIDQLLHLAVIYILWSELSTIEEDWLSSVLSVKVLIVLLAYLLVLNPVSIITAQALKQWDLDVGQTDKSLASAGKAIGMLERFLILTFVLLGQYAGIGFLMAAKSIFRFGDLRESRDHKMTEYVMMGTLLSFTLALLIGLGTSQLLKLV